MFDSLMPQIFSLGGSSGGMLATVISAGLLAAAPAANAETLQFDCKEEQFDSSGTPAGFAEMTVVYEGDDQGTLALKARMGEMKLAATRQRKVQAIAISASGSASVVMPEKAALEACIAGKAKPGDMEDPNTVTYLVAGCQDTVPKTSAPVPVDAAVDITVLDPPAADVFIRRTYVEKSNVPGDHIEIDSFPMPQCTLEEK